MNEWEHSYEGARCPCGKDAEFVELENDNGRPYRVTPGSPMGNKSYREDPVLRIRCAEHAHVHPGEMPGEKRA